MHVSSINKPFAPSMCAASCTPQALNAAEFGCCRPFLSAYLLRCTIHHNLRGHQVEIRMKLWHGGRGEEKKERKKEKIGKNPCTSACLSLQRVVWYRLTLVHQRECFELPPVLQSVPWDCHSQGCSDWRKSGLHRRRLSPGIEAGQSDCISRETLALSAAFSGRQEYVFPKKTTVTIQGRGIEIFILVARLVVFLFASCTIWRNGSQSSKRCALPGCAEGHANDLGSDSSTGPTKTTCMCFSLIYNDLPLFFYTKNSLFYTKAWCSWHVVTGSYLISDHFAYPALLFLHFNFGYLLTRWWVRWQEDIREKGKINNNNTACPPYLASLLLIALLFIFLFFTSPYYVCYLRCRYSLGWRDMG